MRFLISRTIAVCASFLFLPRETKPFAPEFIAGESLGFVLRANATKDQRSVGSETGRGDAGRGPARGRRVDIVGHALKRRRASGTAPDAGTRFEIAETAARESLGARGERLGFALEQLVVGSLPRAQAEALGCYPCEFRRTRYERHRHRARTAPVRQGAPLRIRPGKGIRLRPDAGAPHTPARAGMNRS